MRKKVDYTDLLNPEALAAVGPLDMIATRIVEGFFAGSHRSPYKGGCIEFAEHRPYSPGDEVRLLDWRVYARSDRYCIKQFEEETNLQAIIAVDASGSMGFGLSTLTKIRYALTVSACLTRLMLHQGDAVGLAVLDTKIRTYIPPRSKPSHFKALMDAMTRVETGGETSLSALLPDLARRMKRRGLFILCSDCFDDVDALLHSLNYLRARGHEIMLFHIMAPEELNFTFNKWTRFECLEVQGRRVNLDPAAVRRDYIRRINTFLDRLTQGCGETQCDYAPMTTDRPVGETLAYYLRRREALVK